MTIQEMKTEKAYPVTHESDDLALFGINDRNVYFKMFVPNCANIARKANKGTYNADLAHKAFYNVACYAAQRYCAEFGGVWFKIFSVSDREAAADYFMDNFIDHYTSNDYFWN